MWMVTVKLPRNPEHDPKAKQSGPCPVNGAPCTDTTGEHHTVLSMSWTQVEDLMRDHHITRIEEPAH